MTLFVVPGRVFSFACSSFDTTLIPVGISMYVGLSGWPITQNPHILMKFMSLALGEYPIFDHTCLPSKVALVL